METTYTLTMTGIASREIAEMIREHLAGPGLPPGVHIAITSATDEGADGGS